MSRPPTFRPPPSRPSYGGIRWMGVVPLFKGGSAKGGSATHKLSDLDEHFLSETAQVKVHA